MTTDGPAHDDDAAAGSSPAGVHDAFQESLAARIAQLEPPVRVLARAVRWLRWPSLALVFVFSLITCTLAGLVLSWQGWPRAVGLVLVAGALVVLALFVRSSTGTLRAARHPELVVAELGGFVGQVTDGPQLLAKLSAVAQRGGVRLLPRLTAVWDLWQLPSDVLGALDAQPHLRWLVPPRLALTWTHTLALLWVGLGLFVLTPVLAALSATSVL